MDNMKKEDYDNTVYFSEVLADKTIVELGCPSHNGEE